MVRCFSVIERNLDGLDRATSVTDGVTTRIGHYYLISRGRTISQQSIKCFDTCF